MTKRKNLCGKSRTKENPYATFEGYGPFGYTVVHLLKTYQRPDKERKNPYARWFVAVKSDHTYNSYDMGDSYVKEAVYGLDLTYASDDFKENYYDGIFEDLTVELELCKNI